MAEYFVIVNNEQLGPLSLEELKSKISSGNEMVWYSGLSDWKKFSEIDTEKISESNMPPPPPPVLDNEEIEKPVKHPKPVEPKDESILVKINKNSYDDKWKSILVKTSEMTIYGGGEMDIYPQIIIPYKNIKEISFLEGGENFSLTSRKDKEFEESKSFVKKRTVKSVVVNLDRKEINKIIDVVSKNQEFKKSNAQPKFSELIDILPIKWLFGSILITFLLYFGASGELETDDWIGKVSAVLGSVIGEKVILIIGGLIIAFFLYRSGEIINYPPKKIVFKRVKKKKKTAANIKG